jgi:hypothetical protein
MVVAGAEVVVELPERAATVQVLQVVAEVQD